MSSTSSATPSMSIPSPSETTGGGGGGGGPTSSPLLFFVALGFGVVFTNLWIIVGVKYCFRYNARQRARAAGEDEVDLQQMPRPHRRRREKKLMSLEELNERFPVLKYKSWRALREAQGLSTEGGVSAEAGSRAPSIRSVRHIEDAESSASPAPDAAVVKEVAASTTTTNKDAQPKDTPNDAKENNDNETPKDTPEDTPKDTLKDTPSDTPKDTSKDEVPPASPAIATVVDKEVGGPAADVDAEEKDKAPSVGDRRMSEISEADRGKGHDDDDDDEEEDDDEDHHVDEELLKSVGDSCAICLDMIEDDDDIRGLSCGHAFHAVCIEPWFTNRRACCPLCKADYYVPKPRAEGDSDRPREGDARRRRRQAEREAMQHNFLTRTFFLRGHESHRERPQRRRPEPSPTPAAPFPPPPAETPQSRSWRSRVPNITVPTPAFLRRGDRNSGAQTTPANLEAGQAQAQARAT